MTVEEYDTTAGSLYNKFFTASLQFSSSALIQDGILLDLFVNFLFVRFTCANIGKIHTRKNLYTTKTAFIVCVTWNQPLSFVLEGKRSQHSTYRRHRLPVVLYEVRHISFLRNNNNNNNNTGFRFNIDPNDDKQW